MKRYLILVLLAVVGCQLTISPNEIENESSATKEERLAAADLWTALARAVEARTLTSTTQLARAVTILRRNGELTDADIAQFDSAFPAVTKDERELVSGDATKLRSLK